MASADAAGGLDGTSADAARDLQLLSAKAPWEFWVNCANLQGEPFKITICVLGAARRKQLHHDCNKCHLQSSSSVPDGQRRMKILSEWRFAPDKPMAPSVGDGAIDFLVARTKDGSAEMLCGKVTAHVIVGGTAHWTLRYHGGLEKTVTIDTLNRRLQDRYVLLVQLSERGTAHDRHGPWRAAQEVLGRHR